MNQKVKNHRLHWKCGGDGNQVWDTDHFGKGSRNSVAKHPWPTACIALNPCELNLWDCKCFTLYFCQLVVSISSPPYLSKWSTKASRVLLGGHSFGPDAALLPQGRYLFSALLWWALWRPGKRRLLGQLWHLRTVTRSALFAVLAWFLGAWGARGIGATPTLPTMMAGHLPELDMQPKRSAQTDLVNDVVQYNLFWVRTAGFRKWLDPKRAHPRMKRLYNQGVKDLSSVNHGENQLRWWTFRQCLCHIFFRQQLHKSFFHAFSMTPT